MGSWGTGIKQSDAFADVYDDFFDQYNRGGNATTISNKVIADNREILEIDEEKHELWFALALAQWETKSINSSLFIYREPNGCRFSQCRIFHFAILEWDIATSVSHC